MNLLSLLFLTQFSMAQSASNVVCVSPYMAYPKASNPVAQATLDGIELISENVIRQMSESRGQHFEFCWIEKEGMSHPAFAHGVGTSFWNGTYTNGQGFTGLTYSLQIFNQVFALAKKPEYALMPALFVLYHEMGHATIHFGRATGELAQLVKNRDVLFLLNPLAEKYAGSESALFDALTGNSWGSETFADCYGAFVMGVAMMSDQLSAEQKTFYERVMKAELNAESFRLAMNLAATISSQLIGKDEHGTAKERQSFVAYGVNLADFYIPFIRFSAERAANSALLACANMAYEQNLEKLKFKNQFGINVEVESRIFNRNLGY